MTSDKDSSKRNSETHRDCMPISLHTFPCLLKDSETFKNPSRLEILTWSLLSFGPLALSMCSGEQRGEVSLQLEQKCYTLEEKGLFKTLLSVTEEGEAWGRERLPQSQICSTPGVSR